MSYQDGYPKGVAVGARVYMVHRPMDRAFNPRVFSSARKAVHTYADSFEADQLSAAVRDLRSGTQLFAGGYVFEGREIE